MRAHFCNINSRVLGGMQSGVLVQVKLTGGGLGRGRARGRLCEIDGRGSGRHAVWGAGAGAVLVGLVTARAQFLRD